MLNILVISPDCPFPPGKSGGANALYNLMKAKPEYDVDFLYYGIKDSDGEAALKANVAAVKRVIHAPRLRGGCKAANRIASIFNRVVYAQYQYENKGFNLEKEYDVVVYCQLSSMQFELKTNARRVAFPVDYMPRYFRQQRHGGIIRSLYYLVQESLSRKAFRVALQRFDSIYFVSDVDARQAAEELGDDGGKVEPVGLGVTVPAHIVPKKGMGRSLVFTGVMDYPPNEDAALFLIQEIMPRLRRRYEDLKLYLVGKNPTDRLREACVGKKWIILTGRVDSVFPYIAGATLYVSPLRYGTGVKNKVLEAVACGAALVASPLSVEGIPGIYNGNKCAIVENDQMVDMVSKLLENDDLLAMYRKEARGAASSLCAWNGAWQHIVEGR